MSVLRLFACAVLLFAQAVSAGTNSLTATGPDGGYTYDIEFVTGGLLARTALGVYRSTDGGANWTQTRTAESWSARLMAVNPANRSQVLLGAAAEGLLRSTDGGATWSQVANLPALPQNYVGMVQFSADGSIAWMAQQNGGLLYRSTDTGATWTQINTGRNYPVFEIAPDAGNAQLMYARSADGAFRSIDAGTTFTTLAYSPYVRAIAASRTTDNIVIVSNSDSYGVHVSLDGGLTWPIYSAASLGRIVQSLVYVPGVAGKAFAMDSNYRLLRTLDDGRNWTEVGYAPNGRIEAMAFDPTNPARIFIASAGGIFESTDDGDTWAERNRGLREGNSLAVLTSRAGTGATYLKNRDLSSVYRRTDTGTWNPVGRTSSPLLGLPASPDSSNGFYTLAVSPQNSQRLYMGRDGNFGVSNDGGVSWTRLSTIPNMNTLEVSPLDDQLIVMGGRSATPIWSANGGVSWNSNAGFGLPPDVQNFAFDPTNANVIYAAVDNYLPPAVSAVYKSVDGGATFNPTAWNVDHNASIVWKLVHDPVRPNILYLSCYRGIYKTTDGGATWTHISLFNDQVTSGGPVDLVVDPQSPDVLYASAWARSTLARSVDGGAHWDQFPDSPTLLLQFNSIALVPGTRTKVVAARWNGSREIDFQARLALTGAPTSATLNAPASTVFTIANSGVIAASGVRLTATLPASSTTPTAVASSGTCTITGTALSCEIGALLANTQTTVTVGYTPTATGSWSATVAAYEPEDTDTDNTRQISLNAPAAAPSAGGGGSGGGGGGGRLDYLLLLLLAGVRFIRDLRLAPMTRVENPSSANSR